MPQYKNYKILMIDRMSFVTLEASLNKSLTYYVGNGWEVLSITPTKFSEDGKEPIAMCVVVQRSKDYDA